MGKNETEKTVKSLKVTCTSPLTCPHLTTLFHRRLITWDPICLFPFVVVTVLIFSWLCLFTRNTHLILMSSSGQSTVKTNDLKHHGWLTSLWASQHTQSTCKHPVLKLDCKMQEHILSWRQYLYPLDWHILSHTPQHTSFAQHSWLFAKLCAVKPQNQFVEPLSCVDGEMLCHNFLCKSNLGEWLQA